jgi:hypothetical protein
MTFSKIFATKPGDSMIAYGDFTCVAAGAIVTIEADMGGMFFRCADGQHYLESQVDKNGECLGLTALL